MYTKILLPTDGSELANATIHAGIEFAKQINANVVAVFVASNYQYPIYIDIIPPNTPTEEEYQTAMRSFGQTYLESANEAAKQAGVPFESIVQFNDSPAKEIVHTAKLYGCDLISWDPMVAAASAIYYWGARPRRCCRYAIFRSWYTGPKFTDIRLTNRSLRQTCSKPRKMSDPTNSRRPAGKIWQKSREKQFFATIQRTGESLVQYNSKCLATFLAMNLYLVPIQ